MNLNHQENTHLASAGNLAGWGGRRSIQAGSEKQRRVLDWIYRWGYSSGALITSVSGASRRDYAKRLHEKGLLRKTPASRCSITKTLYTLTEEGLAHARRATTYDLDYPELDSRKIAQAVVYHNLICQREILHALNHQTQHFIDWESDRQFGPNLHETKRPDGVLLAIDGKRTGVEIELSGKWARRLDQFVQRIVGSIHHARFEGYLVFVATEQMKARYQEAFKAGRRIHKWSQGQDNKFFRSGETPPIPETISERVKFHILEL